jgi:hypothetical protein
MQIIACKTASPGEFHMGKSAGIHPVIYIFIMTLSMAGSETTGLHFELFACYKS